MRNCIIEHASPRVTGPGQPLLQAHYIRYVTPATGILRVTRPIWMGNRGSLTVTVQSEAFKECANVLSDRVHKLRSPMTVTP
jgi:hypothetical protein